MKVIRNVIKRLIKISYQNINYYKKFIMIKIFNSVLITFDKICLIREVKIEISRRKTSIFILELNQKLINNADPFDYKNSIEASKTDNSYSNGITTTFSRFSTSTVDNSSNI